MTMPFTCDALLPRAERYASLKFRRFARRFEADRLDWSDLCELSAFLHVVPVRFAKFAFHWPRPVMLHAQAVFDAIGNKPDVLAMADENFRLQDVDDGLALIKSMQDGGWTSGAPLLVRQALGDMRARGMSMGQIAAVAGLTRERVRNATSQRSTGSISSGAFIG